MLGVKIKVPHLRRRPITSTSDHFYMPCPTGNVKIEKCEFSRGGDDCFNIYALLAFSYKIGEKSLRIITLTSLNYFSKGAKLELRDAKFFPFGIVSTVANVNAIDAARKIYDLEFSEKLPVQRNGGFLLFNTDYAYSNTIIKDFFFHDNRARGLLLQSLNINVENCRFKHNEMTALRLEAGYALGI